MIFILNYLSSGAEMYISQARDWETRAEYNRAIDLYLRITPQMVSNIDTLGDVYAKAVGLAIKFSKDRAVSAAHEVCNRLLQVQGYETVSFFGLHMNSDTASVLK